jgi:flavin-dependent dehydrogenase
VGSGIVGLHAACACEKHQSKILVLEKGCYHMVRALRMLVLPALEVFLIDDLKHSEEEVYQLVTKRLEGLRLLSALEMKL